MRRTYNYKQAVYDTHSRSGSDRALGPWRSVQKINSLRLTSIAFRNAVYYFHFLDWRTSNHTVIHSAEELHYNHTNVDDYVSRSELQWRKTCTLSNFLKTRVILSCGIFIVKRQLIMPTRHLVRRIQLRRLGPLENGDWHFTWDIHCMNKTKMITNKY